MIRLAGEVFSARTDPDQLDVDEAVIERLQSLHPATLSEHVEGDGPVVWILLIPTTRETMDLFLITRLENANYWTGLILANTLTPYTCVRLWCYRSSEERPGAAGVARRYPGHSTGPCDLVVVCLALQRGGDVLAKANR